MVKVTVFTPTYNRAYIIENLYHSLQRQTVKDFEWIVIDDGSSDKTEELFSSITLDSNEFNIKYIKFENGGKHIAINKALPLANGDLFFIVDSDDYLTDNAIEKLIEVEASIPADNKDNFAGVCGIKAYTPEIWVGSTFHGSQYLDATSLEREKYQINGDKAEVFYTDILKKYPFPEFEGENFLSECIVWDRIAHDGYKLRFFNAPIYICDYLPDGLSANCDTHFARSPKGYELLISQSIEFGKIQGLRKWEAIRGYYNAYKRKLSVREIAKRMHVNAFTLPIRIFLMRVFYRLYR